MLRLPATLELSPYAGIVIHCAVAYSPANLFSLDQGLKRPFEEYDGLKVLMKQDEHVETTRFAEFIGKKKFDIVITCVPPEEVSKVYPGDIVGDVRFIHAFTGYVSPALRSLKRTDVSERSIHISYRGSIQPLEFGRLGYEKRGIGFDMAIATADVPNLRADISSRSQDRIGGNAWFDFLNRSKVVLGAESGSNLFDFTGEVAKWCRGFEARNLGDDPFSKEYYLRAHGEYLHRFEGNVNYAQVSPRHFEATACGAAQILYEGEYSGIFKPHRHFMPLKRDLSNIREVLDFARDDRRVKEYAERAYDEIILDPVNQYQHYVELFDDGVQKLIEQKGLRSNSIRRSGKQSVLAPKVLMLMAHPPSDDPRIDWFSKGLAEGFQVCELGLHSPGSQNLPPSIERISKQRTRICVDGSRNHWNFIPPSGSAAGRGLASLLDIALMGQVPRSTLGDALGALDITDQDLDHFRWRCNYFLRSNSTLLESARRIGGFDLLVAADLYALPAAVAVAEERGVPLVYDAHEFWPYSVPGMRHWEVSFWAQIERSLLERVSFALTVSPQLADAMALHYGCSFDYVPNCASLGEEKAVDLEAALNMRSQSEDLVFLVQGGIGALRGFDKLISAWVRVDRRAKLLLRGPDGPYKNQMIEFAKSKGILDKSVFFPRAVSESDLVRAARDGDVGIIPYEPTIINHRFCSPNKLSQYMAAGLPIISNELDFVKSIVLGYGIGSVVDFGDEAALVRTIDEYVQKRGTIPELSRRARSAFVREFNWQNMSRRAYERIRSLAPRHGSSEFDLGWITEGAAFESSLSALEERLATTQAEWERYRDEVDKLNVIYPNEIERLHGAYRAEIERISKYHVLRFIPRPLKKIARAVLGRRM
ncbi:MAG: glycosyltransferase [Hyphomicrobiales bacterium]|nr:glycosyltransferase [Hyphomicrobiales bacterium]